jgi:hypothetical protein
MPNVFEFIQSTFMKHFKGGGGTSYKCLGTSALYTQIQGKSNLQICLGCLYCDCYCNLQMAHAVNRLCLTSEAQSGPCGICGGQSGTGTGFVRVLRFPLSISFHQGSHGHSSEISFHPLAFNNMNNLR